MFNFNANESQVKVDLNSANREYAIHSQNISEKILVTEDMKKGN